MEKFKKQIWEYFTDVHHHRSEQQLESEKWLIPKVIPFSRWFLIPAAMLMQICLGTIYAWSGFNLPIEAKMYGLNGGIDRAMAVNVFYVATLINPVSSALAGPWLERNGPKKGALVGGTIYYLGHLITALGVYLNQMPVVYIGYGVFAAAGIGITYISPVSALQKWFPEMRGLAAGLAVCGYGAGSIIAPYAQKALIGKNYALTGVGNLGVELTFVILGSCYFVVIISCALVLRMPLPGYEIKGINIHTVKGAEQQAIPKVHSDASFDSSTHFSMTLQESIWSKQYWMIYVMFMGHSLTGILILSKIQSIVQNQLGKSPDEAAKINTVLGAVNLLGRALLPLTSDLIRTRRPLYVCSLATQVILLGCLPTAMHNQSYAGVLFCYLTITFLYGGGLGMIPAFLADQFGARNVGPTHGLILTAAGINGVAGGFIFSAVYKQQKEAHPHDMLSWYDLDFRWLLAPVLLSFLISLFIPCSLRDNRLPRLAGETHRFRILNLPLIRIIHGWPVIVSKNQEEIEWNQYFVTLKETQEEMPAMEKSIFKYQHQCSEMSLISSDPEILKHDSNYQNGLSSNYNSNTIFTTR